MTQGRKKAVTRQQAVTGRYLDPDAILKRAYREQRVAKKAVTPRYKMPFPVLIPATKQQIKRRDYDGIANFDSRKPLQPVKIFGPKYIQEGSDLNREVRKAMGKRWNLFSAAMQLRDAHTKGSDYEIQAAFHKLLEAMTPDPATVAGVIRFWAQPSWTKRNAPLNLPPAITYEMDSARFVLWWNTRRKQFQPAIYCKDFGTAMFVVGSLRDLRACPECGKPFIPERADQEYHDARCRDRHRTRRHRAKQRER